MMTLEVFNAHVLKGKTAKELYDLLEDFKVEKVFLKVQIEQENIAEFTLPSREMIAKINNYRLYIRETYRQIEELGGIIERADVEEFALKFQENIPNIQKIDYQIGGYFGEHKKYILTFVAEHVHIEKIHSREDSVPVKVTIGKKDFLNEFAKLYVGEWRESYSDSDYGKKILDGTTWSLQVHFSNEMDTAEFEGTNAFPYNFGTFNKLIDSSMKGRI